MKEEVQKMFDINLILNKIAVREGWRVADFGCGYFGHFCFPLAKTVGTKGLVYAIDILPSAVTEIKKRAYQENIPQIKAIWGDLEKFKGSTLDSNSLDAVVLINILNQSEQKTAIIRESVRIAKRNALIVIIDWKDKSLDFGPDLKMRLNSDSLKNALSKLSLSLIEEFSAGSHYQGFLLKKI
jgi:ubiquinone/menaquinone biosynthesis C-methylase UbiE